MTPVNELLADLAEVEDSVAPSRNSLFLTEGRKGRSRYQTTNLKATFRCDQFC